MARLFGILKIISTFRWWNISNIWDPQFLTYHASLKTIPPFYTALTANSNCGKVLCLLALRAEGLLFMLPFHPSLIIGWVIKLSPKKVQNTITQIQRNFLWRGNNRHFGYIAVAWSQPLRLPSLSVLVGLGLQDLEFRCGAFHANTLWRFFTQPSVMWARLLSQKYLKGQDIRDYNRKPTNSPF